MRLIFALGGDRRHPATGARAGATLPDICEVAWGKVLAEVDPEALVVTGAPTIAIPDRIPDVS